ncbi:MAG: cupin domain-containing protein [Proteobacteria bacterium]|nr:cupin domain-containing protein [Burkholderiales bacterium]
MTHLKLPAIDPRVVPAVRGSNYPEPYASRVAGRVKRRIGEALGLRNFGVNLVLLEPRSCSALRHWHTRQDEFIYVLEGELVLVSGAGEQVLGSGMAAGFPAGQTDGHHLMNRTDLPAVYLEVGDRLPGDAVVYPDDDLAAKSKSPAWTFTRKNGVEY